ncbi:MAG: hypothetical protein ABSA69_11295 [Verrucomicrobiota bacterium]
MLQSIAWTRMLADNLGGCSFTEAVHKTFDGKHPCCLCKAIAAGRKAEQKRDFTTQPQKLEFPPVKENLVLIAPSNFQPLPRANTFADSLTHKPPTPPPRGILF